MASSKNRSGAGKKATAARTWKRSIAEDLELPSGNVALVKRPGPSALMQRGILPDSLTPLVTQAIQSHKGMKPEEVDVSTPEKMMEFLDAIDMMTALVVVEPKVLWHKRFPDGSNGEPNMDATPVPIPAQERVGEDEAVYTDEVDLDDKMFIFQFAVGGTRSWERFRQESQSGVGSLDDVSGDAVSP